MNAEIWNKKNKTKTVYPIHFYLVLFYAKLSNTQHKTKKKKIKERQNEKASKRCRLERNIKISNKIIYYVIEFLVFYTHIQSNQYIGCFFRSHIIWVNLLTSTWKSLSTVQIRIKRRRKTKINIEFILQKFIHICTSHHIHSTKNFHFILFPTFILNVLF